MTVTIRPSGGYGEASLPDVDLSADLAGWQVDTAVLLASGCAAAGQELASYNDLTAIGGVVTKSISLQPRAGRPTPRMAETASGMLNSIGLQGPGIDGFLARDLPWLADRGIGAVVSIAGSSIEHYAKLAARLRGQRLAAIEVN